MTTEWLPDWWLNSEIYKWMAGPGSWILPTFLHTASLVLEITVFSRLAVAHPKNRNRVHLWLYMVLAIHLITFIGTLTLLDGGHMYRFWSALWTLCVLWIALAALVSIRRADARTRKIQEKYAKLRDGKSIERKP